MLKNFKIAGKIFQTHRTRTFLSVLGIVIGIMSVIAIINAGQQLKSLIKGQVEVFGTDYIEVEIKVPNTAQNSTENVSGFAQGITITTLKYKDGEKIKENPNISQVYMGLMSQDLVSYQDSNEVGLIWGVSEGFFDIDKTEIVAGRSFTKEEDDSLAQVAVIGQQVQEDLFGDEDALGKRIKIGNTKFKVIGVRQKLGSIGFFNMDELIIVPVKTLQKKVMGVDYIQFIMASVIDTSRVDETVDEITTTMREAHDITDPSKDDFAVTSSKQATEMLDVILNAMTLFLVAIAAISLIVGGVGVMNIMYVSVLERTYEIGLRKAVGATNQDILQQFLGESILISLLGGIIGVIFGMLLTLVISLGAQAQGFDITFEVSVPGIFIACIFMILTGLIFGLYPAKRAAGFNPVEALRYE
jgi:putative ABC transport system permease protein